MKMAILLDFKKVRDDHREIEYIFGYRASLDRHLTIDKESLEGRPNDGNRDRNFAAIYAKILRLQHHDGIWPEAGTYAA
jgi:hypothetical protein